MNEETKGALLEVKGELEKRLLFARQWLEDANEVESKETPRVFNGPKSSYCSGIIRGIEDARTIVNDIWYSSLKGDSD